jgi:hypothetical protein
MISGILFFVMRILPEISWSHTTKFLNNRQNVLASNMPTFSAIAPIDKSLSRKSFSDASIQ